MLRRLDEQLSASANPSSPLPAPAALPPAGATSMTCPWFPRSLKDFELVGLPAFADNWQPNRPRPTVLISYLRHGRGQPSERSARCSWAERRRVRPQPTGTVGFPGLVPVRLRTAGLRAPGRQSLTRA